MSWLPIVDRELRVAARRRKTWGIRLLAAVIALLICAWVCLYLARTLPAPLLGKTLFSYLTVLAVAYCLLVGPFITADALSEEKRDGTLGLLFLTDLRSYDVVFGKWVAASMDGLYGLLAILPALGLPLLLGGVTPEEYGRTALAVVNAIFFSLAAGIFVSAVSRDHGKAIFGSVVLILGIAGLLPGLVTVIQTGFFAQPMTAGTPTAYVISPAWTAYLATDGAFRASPGAYWKSFAVVHSMAWIFLALTVAVLPRLWREDPSEKPVRYRWLHRFGYTGRWRRLFRRRLETNPIYALEARLRWPHLVFWLLVALVVVNVGWLTFGYRRATGGMTFHSYFSMSLVFTNRVWVAVMACWFFIEARRNGALELLLTTPIPERTILRGHWRAVRHLFFWPVIAIALLHVFYVVVGTQVRNPNVAFGGAQMSYLLASAGSSLTCFLSDVVAICFVGAWLSLSSRRPTFAVLATFSGVILFPWMIGSLLPGLTTVVSWLPAKVAAYLQQTLFRDLLMGGVFADILGRAGVWVSKNLLFIVWARHQLHRHFRSAAAQTHGSLGPGGGWWFRRRSPAPSVLSPARLANPVAET